MRYNPRIGAVLGALRARRRADFMRNHLCGFAANVSLGPMPGLLPAVAGCFGIGRHVRQVELPAGQIAAAAVSQGWLARQPPMLWWAVAAIPAIGALTVSVSFRFAFRLALRAHSVSLADRARIRAALRARWHGRPPSFFLPA